MSFVAASLRKDLSRWWRDRMAFLLWLSIPFLIGGLITTMVDSGNGAVPTANTGWVLGSDEFYYPSTDSWGNAPIGGANAVRLTYQELWAQVSVKYHAYNHIQPMFGNGPEVQAVLDTVTYEAPTQKNANMLSACSEAKDNGVLVFSVISNGHNRGDEPAMDALDAFAAALGPSERAAR